jgi:ATP-dependent DNA helicase RecG
MIDTVGSGIKKMFITQRERYFPMPTYNISDERHTEVTIHGELINENYSRQMIMPLLPSELSIEKKRKKVSNMTSDLSFKERKIKNISSSTKSPIWELVNE